MKYFYAFLFASLVAALSSPPNADAQIGSWTSQTIPSEHGTIMDIHMFDLQNGVAAGYPNLHGHLSGILITMSGGAQWNPILIHEFYPPIPDWTVWRAVYMVDPWTIYVAGDSALCYVTFDGGMTWNQDTITDGIKGYPTIRDLYFLTATDGYAVGGDSFIHQPPFGNPPVEPFGPAIFRKQTGAKTWIDESPSSFLLPSRPILYGLDHKNGVWAVCGETAAVLIRSGSVWTKSTPTSNSMDILKDITVVNGQEMIVSGLAFAANAAKAYITLNGGARWLSIGPASPPGMPEFASNHFFSSKYGWVGSQQSYLAVTTNTGTIWKTFQVPGTQTLGPLRRMDFVDSLNGWAVGGDTASGGRSAWIIRYSGIPPKPDISLSQTSAVFPEIRCERYTEITVSLRNTGTGELVLPDFESIKFSSKEYSLVNVSFPIRINPGAGRQVTVRWTPERTSVGVVHGMMSVFSNDLEHTPWQIKLQGFRNTGAIEFPSVVDIYPGACIYDSTTFTIYAGSSGTLPPAFLRFDFVSGSNEFRLVSPKTGTTVSGSLPFTFRFTPKQSGLRSGVYRFISGNPSCPDTLLITFNGIGEFTRISPAVTTIDFGKQCINTVRDTVITLKNTGNTFAIIESSELKSGLDVFPVISMLPVFLAPDSTISYRVQFAPQFTGTYETEYRIISSPCRDTVVLTFKGEAISTEIAFQPRSSIVVGPTIVGRQVARTVKVQNIGKTAAELTLLTFSPSHPDLVLKNLPPLPMLMLPNASFDIVIEYIPKNLGTIETRLVAAWSSVCGDTATLDVFAPCVPNPHIDPPVVMDVGLQECPAPIRRTLWIRNRGNGPLVFVSSSTSGIDPSHFRLISPAAGDTVKARDSIRLIVEYNRANEGSSSASLYLNHNDFERMPTLISLTGRRTVMEFAISGDSTTEFFTRLFIPQSRTFVIHNPGIRPVTISEITVLKSEAVFSVIPSVTLPYSIPPAGRISFDAVFTPNGRGPFEAIIQATSTPCNTKALLTLRGRGDTDGLSIDRGNINFMLDPCAFMASYDTLRLGNQGVEPVSVTGLRITQGASVFSVSSAPATPFQVDPGREVNLVLRADPSAFGASTGALEITSNDPLYPTLNIALTARRDSSNITVSTAAIDFGRMTHCSSGFTQSVTVTNTGFLPEIVSTALASGNSGFSSDGGADITLLPGRSFSFSVSFDRPHFGAFNDTLLVTTIRCERVIRIPLSGEWVDQRYAAAPKPLVFPSVNIGSSSTRSLSVQNAGGFDARISAVRILPAGEYTVLPGYPSTIQAGNSASLQFRFAPTSEGARSATACIIFDVPCRDTICVDLSGTGVRGRLVLSSAVLSFGVLAQCEQRIIEDTLTNTGTGPVTLLSSVLSGPGAAAFTNLDPVSTSEILPPGGFRVFRVQYSGGAAPSDGPVNAIMSIMTDDPIQNVVDLPLDGFRETLIPAAGVTMSLGSIERAQPVQRTLTLRNEGSAQLCYAAERRHPDITWAPGLPLCINPGDSAVLTITTTPSVAGLLFETLVLLTQNPCIDSTLVRIDANVQQGAISIASTHDFGSGPYCGQRFVSLRVDNTYLVDATLNSAAITGPDAAFFSVTAPPTFPQTIPAGGSIIIRVSYLGLNADRVYNATLNSNFAVFGQSVARTTQLSATTQRIFLATVPVDFGNVFVGQAPAQATTVVTNTSTLDIRVDSIESSSPDITVTGVTPPLPVLLQPGQTLTIQLLFSPTRSGDYNETLMLTSHTPCPDEKTFVQITGRAIQQQTVLAALSVGALSGKPYDKILIPVFSDKDLGNSFVASWSGSLSFNRSMLYPLRAVREGSLSADMNVSMQYEHSEGRVRLLADGASVRQGNQALIYVECLVLIGNDIQTTIQLSDDFDFGTGFAVVTQRTNGVFTLDGWCYSNGRLIEDLGFNSLMQSRPNPISGQTASRTSITWSVAQDGPVELALFDSNGKKLMIIHAGFAAKGTHESTADLNGLPAGVYYYQLTAGGFRAARSLVIR